MALTIALLAISMAWCLEIETPLTLQPTIHDAGVDVSLQIRHAMKAGWYHKDVCSLPPLIDQINAYDIPLQQCIKTDEHSLTYLSYLKRNDHMASYLASTFASIWEPYQTRAFTFDCLDPLSGNPRKLKKKGIGLLILQNLDLVYLLGSQEWFEECLAWLKSQDFNWKRHVQLTIEEASTVLNALVSTYDITLLDEVKEKALLWGDRVVTPFFKDGPVPYAEFNLRTKQGVALESIEIEDVVAFHIGLLRLGQWDPGFQSITNATVEYLKEHHLTGLSGTIELKNNSFAPIRRMSSEVCGTWLKAVKLGQETQSLYDSCMAQLPKLLLKTESESIYIGSMRDEDMGPYMSDHYCGIPGLLALNNLYSSEQGQGILTMSHQLLQTCLHLQMSTGLLPRSLTLLKNDTVILNDASNILAPYIPESLFYLYQATNHDQYRRAAIFYLDNLKSIAQTKYGFSTIPDLQSKKQSDQFAFKVMDNLRFVYYLFAPAKVANLEEFVITPQGYMIAYVEHSYG